MRVSNHQKDRRVKFYWNSGTYSDSTRIVVNDVSICLILFGGYFIVHSCDCNMNAAVPQIVSTGWVEGCPTFSFSFFSAWNGCRKVKGGHKVSMIHIINM